MFIGNSSAAMDFVAVGKLPCKRQLRIFPCDLVPYIIGRLINIIRDKTKEFVRILDCFDLFQT